jgi:hypothetical protein
MACFTLETYHKIPIHPPDPVFHLVDGLAILPLIYFAWKPPILDLTVWFLIFILLNSFVFKSELNDYLYRYLISIVCLLIWSLIHSRHGFRPALPVILSRIVLVLDILQHDGGTGGNPLSTIELSPGRGT